MGIVCIRPGPGVSRILPGQEVNSSAPLRVWDWEVYQLRVGRFLSIVGAARFHKKEFTCASRINLRFCLLLLSTSGHQVVDLAPKQARTGLSLCPGLKRYDRSTPARPPNVMRASLNSYNLPLGIGSLVSQSKYVVLSITVRD